MNVLSSMKVFEVNKQKNYRSNKSYTIKINMFVTKMILYVMNLVLELSFYYNRSYYYLTCVYFTVSLHHILTL